MKKLLFAISLFLIPAAVMAQGLDPALLTKPATDSWPTYSGDYSGRRFSTLTQINQSNMKDLALSWVGHLTAGAGLADSQLRESHQQLSAGKPAEAGPGGRRRCADRVFRARFCK